MNKTPRSVRVYIGRPEGLEDDDVNEGQSASPDECFTIEFSEEGGEEGFTAQCVCLCSLAAATEAWLTGKSEEDVQEAMTGGHEHGDAPG